jgi:hypothetical protein
MAFGVYSPHAYGYGAQQQLNQDAQQSWNYEQDYLGQKNSFANQRIGYANDAAQLAAQLASQQSSMASQGYNLQGDLQNQQLRELQARQQLAEFARQEMLRRQNLQVNIAQQELRNRFDLAQRQYQMFNNEVPSDFSKVRQLLGYPG